MNDQHKAKVKVLLRRKIRSMMTVEGYEELGIKEFDYPALEKTFNLLVYGEKYV